MVIVDVSLGGRGLNCCCFRCLRRWEEDDEDVEEDVLVQWLISHNFTVQSVPPVANSNADDGVVDEDDEEYDARG